MSPLFVTGRPVLHLVYCKQKNQKKAPFISISSVCTPLFAFQIFTAACVPSVGPCHQNVDPCFSE